MTQRASPRIPRPAAAARLRRPARAAGSSPRASSTSAACRPRTRRCANCRRSSPTSESLLNILDSIRRMVIGFALALAVRDSGRPDDGAQPRCVAAFFNPLLMIIYPVPKAALMPIIMLWLGVGDASKTLVIFLGVSLPVIYHAYQGARAVEEKMLWSAAAMGMGARGAAAAHRVSRRAARDHGRHPHRARARADHHGDERDDRAQAGRRRHPVQRARDGAVRNRLRHDRHHRHARLRDRRRCSSGCARVSSAGPSRCTRSPRWAPHDGRAPHRRDRHRHRCRSR